MYCLLLHFGFRLRGKVTGGVGRYLVGPPIVRIQASGSLQRIYPPQLEVTYVAEPNHLRLRLSCS